MSDVLARICADTRAEVARRKAGAPLAEAASPLRGFSRALRETAGAGRFALIAEIKKASPSGGLIRQDFRPADLARAYAAGGATCVSVLTDGPHFQGSPTDLVEARAAVALPVLRKDFMLDPWQLAESRAIGADCVLLILAALSGAEATELEQAAHALGMDVLAEVHDRAELERALRLKTSLIGINNRNLKTLRTDLNTTVMLAPLVPADRMVVAESGLRTHDDLRRLSEVGVRAFLVGEGLLRQADVAAATRVLLGG
jgi:indole-3-glycerol phosphate synthase